MSAIGETAPLSRAVSSCQCRHLQFCLLAFWFGHDDHRLERSMKASTSSFQSRGPQLLGCELPWFDQMCRGGRQGGQSKYTERGEAESEQNPALRFGAI